MYDLRMIDISDNGTVTITSENMDVPLTEFEESIQRIVIAIYNTPGSMVDFSNWGGGLKKMINKIRVRESKKTFEQVLSSALDSLLASQPHQSDYAIENLILKKFEKTDRGFNATIEVTYQGASSGVINVPI